MDGEAEVLRTEAAAQRLLVVEPDVAALQRGGLSDGLDSAVEAALLCEGAAAAGAGDGSGGLEGMISDQLFRLRAVGFSGMVVLLGSLQRLAHPERTLDPQDSAALRWWAALTCDRPIFFFLHGSNRSLSAYAAPQRLDALLSAEPPARSTRELGVVAGQRTGLSIDGSASLHHLAVEPVRPTPAESTRLRRLEEPRPDSADSIASRLEWREWVRVLEGARGPKPIGVVERLFSHTYVPLHEAVATGAADANARQALATWSGAFAKSFSESFGAVRVTGKRPAMVFDVPQIASRIARLHGARTTQLILVDSMRFDLGKRVLRLVTEQLASVAALAEHVLLWSALPTTTPTQLDLLARGPAALRDPLPPTEYSDPVARGRTALSLRRIKIGARDLLKLDAAEARLSEAGPALAERLDALAAEIAPPLVAHARSVQPNTLLFIFGDHGFCLEEAGGETGAATQGGSTPEEVLVPGFALLVGGVH